MAKPPKSQWDFGELFPTESPRRVLTVTELTAQVKRLLEKQVGQVWVTGEITNLRAQGSGHIYFTLKDAGTQLSCVLFRGVATAQRGLLQDGQKVVLQGELTVYEARGQYQLLVRGVELQGVGALQIAFEKLKQKLQAEGLFATERKRPIPRYPQRIGLVTSPTGAAIRDVLHVIERRQPGLEIILVPCRVQGQGAAEEIAAAVRLLNEFAVAAVGDLRASPDEGTRRSPTAATGLDLILVTRGGGSLEDLWAFNEEVLARALFESVVPVVSAIGHEIDFTIADFVADLRAATPSVAAEMITEGMFASREFVVEAAGRLRQRAARRLERARADWEQWNARLHLAHPRRRLNESLQRLDDLQAALVRGANSRWRACHTGWQTHCLRLRRVKPAQWVARRQQALREFEHRLLEQTRRQFQVWQHRLAHAAARLRLLAPDNVLARGYSITADAANGRVIRAAAEVKAGQRLTTRLQSGEINSVAEP